MKKYYKCLTKYYKYYSNPPSRDKSIIHIFYIQKIGVIKLVLFLNRLQMSNILLLTAQLTTTGVGDSSSNQFWLLDDPSCFQIINNPLNSLGFSEDKTLEDCLWISGCQTSCQHPVLLLNHLPKIQVHAPDALVSQNTETPVAGETERFIWFGQSKRTGEHYLSNPSSSKSKSRECLCC